MNSNQIMQTILQIGLVPGKNDKQRLLSMAMEDDQFAKTMQYAYNPFITFGVRPARRAEGKNSVYEYWDESTWELLDKLASREYTGDYAKSMIAAQWARLDESSAELLWRVLNKDMKAGFSENSINKVSKDFIPSTPYMRCSLPKDANLEDWNWREGVISQVKADGMFFNGNVELNSVSFTTRQGQPLPVEGFEELMEDFAKAFNSVLNSSVCDFENGIQTHGELLVKDELGVVLPRQVGNGLINKLVKGTSLPAEHKLVAELWDIIPKSSVVKKGSFDVDYLARLRTLNSAVGYVKAQRLDSSIQVIETKVVRTYEDAMAHYYDARSRYLEGTIVKKPELKWKDGTSKDQVKLKQEVVVELEVYGFEEGKEGGKTEATFGSLKCKTSDGILKVNVGSGFTDEQRTEINNNREEWIGAIVAIKANEIMYAKRGKIEHSLFLPIYVEHRHDKRFADSFAQVEEQFKNAVNVVENRC